MFGFVDARDVYLRVYDPEGDSQARFPQEVLAPAAAFAGMKSFEEHYRNDGNKTFSHPAAKELLAGFVSTEVDRLARNKALDQSEREEIKKQAIPISAKIYDDYYIQQHRAEEYDPQQYEAPNFDN